MVGTPDIRQEFNNPLHKQPVAVAVGVPLPRGLPHVIGQPGIAVRNFAN
jgi:hypothetical protein